MRFLRTTRYPGGALGEITNAIAEIQSSLEQLKAVYPIHLRPQGNSASIEFMVYGGGTEGDYAFKITATENMTKTAIHTTRPALQSTSWAERADAWRDAICL